MYMHVCTVCIGGLMPSAAYEVPFTDTRGRLEINFHSSEDWLSPLSVLLLTNSASQIGALLNPEKKSIYFIYQRFSHETPKAFFFSITWDELEKKEKQQKTLSPMLTWEQ